MKYLALDDGGVISVEHNLDSKSVYLLVNRDKSIWHGKPLVSWMLTKI